MAEPQETIPPTAQEYDKTNLDIAQRIMEQSGLLRVADQASLLEDQNRNLAMDRAVVARQHQLGFKLVGADDFTFKEEDMGVSVGNTINNHYYPPPAPEPAVQTSQMVTPIAGEPTLLDKAKEQAKSKWPTWLKAGLLLLTGAGSGIGVLEGIPAILDLIRGEKQEVPASVPTTPPVIEKPIDVVPIDPDTDTTLDIRLRPPVTKGVDDPEVTVPQRKPEQ